MIPARAFCCSPAADSKRTYGRCKMKERLRGRALSADSFWWAGWDWRRTKHSWHLQLRFPRSWELGSPLEALTVLWPRLGAVQTCLWVRAAGKGTATPHNHGNGEFLLPKGHSWLSVPLWSTRWHEAVVPQYRAGSLSQDIFCPALWKWCSSKLCSLTEYELSSSDPLIRWPFVVLKTIFAL